MRLNRLSWRDVIDITCRILAVALLLFVVVVLALDVATAWTRQVVMAFSIVAWSSFAGYQIIVALRAEGFPRRFPLPFRWVFALYKMALAAFMIWHLAASLTDIYSRELSMISWMIMGEALLYLFRRWVLLGRSRQAGHGETGSNGGQS